MNAATAAAGNPLRLGEIRDLVETKVSAGHHHSERIVRSAVTGR